MCGIGLTVMKRLAGEVGKMPRELWPLVAQHWSNPKSFLGMAAHFETLAENAREMSGAPLLSLPAIVLTAGRSAERVSTDQRHIVAAKSGHWIQLDEPELVAQAVRDLA